MAVLEDVPEVIVKAHGSLKSFIKQRQEAIYIRRILAIYLGSHVNTTLGIPTSNQLPLADATWNLDFTFTSSTAVTGVQKEYLQSLLANIKARKEYETFHSDHRTTINEGNRKSRATTHATASGSEGSNAPIISLHSDYIKQQRRHGRLSIVQDYVDMLSEKPAAAREYLYLEVALGDATCPPNVPAEVMALGQRCRNPQRVDLQDLMDRLEKTVLRAKFQLKREQHLRSIIKADASSLAHSRLEGSGVLQALDVTRNELIAWIEEELSKAGESSTPLNLNTEGPRVRGEKIIDGKLELTKRQYARYTTVRQTLISSATKHSEPPSPAAVDRESSADQGIHLRYSATPVVPYLIDLMDIAEEQKTMIQQKSHLTISLAKQLNDANIGLDRLAGESHLLPTYGSTSKISQQNSVQASVSSGKELADFEKPSSSQHARAWALAAVGASLEVNDIITSSFGEGDSALVEARESLCEIRALLGIPLEPVMVGKTPETDIWAALDGNLGIIGQED